MLNLTFVLQSLRKLKQAPPEEHTAVFSVPNRLSAAADTAAEIKDRDVPEPPGSRK